MSVYTKIEPDELKAFLAHYTVGDLINFQGIKEGIENTNYFVTTTGGEWVLTIFETVAAEDLPFFLGLMDHLHHHGIPSPAPVTDCDNRLLREIKGKMAALVQRLDGRSPQQPSLEQCRAMGDVMARLHVAAASFQQRRANPRGPHWWQSTARALLAKLAADDAALLESELAYQSAFRHLDLPRGIIHGDLFHDNALFLGDRLSGVIDFYYACSDVLLFDIAIAVNDWCSRDDGTLDDQRCQVVLNAYHRRRPFKQAEAQAWQPLLRAAALRFWLSRLYDMHFPRPGEITHTKDPDTFRRILMHRTQDPPRFLAGLPGASE